MKPIFIVGSIFIFLKAAATLPLLWVFLLVGIVGFSFVRVTHLVPLPERHLGAWRNYCYLVMIAVCLGFIPFILYGLLLGTSSTSIDLTLSMLGTTKIGLSQDRLLRLAVQSRRSGPEYFGDLSDEQKRSLDFEVWKRRTEECETEECYQVSNQLIAESLPAEEKADRFYLMLQACRAEVDLRVGCKKLYLKKSPFGPNILALGSSEQARVWMESNDKIKQYAGFLAYVCAGSPEAAVLSKYKSSSIGPVANLAREMEWALLNDPKMIKGRCGFEQHFAFTGHGANQ